MLLYPITAFKISPIYVALRRVIKIKLFSRATDLTRTFSQHLIIYENADAGNDNQRI